MPTDAELDALALARISALDEAIASGANRVSYEGKSVDYRTLEEMLRVRADIAATLLHKPRLRTIRTTTLGDKGL